MIGILIITHGPLGDCLIDSARHVLNKPLEQIETMSISAQDDPGLRAPEAQEAINRLDTGRGVMVMTDIYGATPANIACRVLVQGRVEGVAGVNLPMLLRALTYREKTLNLMITRSITGACDGVIHMNTDVCYAQRRN